jgi:hypothetical protein
MPGSLIVGPYDLLAFDSPATLLGFAGTDFGTGTPDVTTVSRILLDGDVVAGTRTGNRLVKLVVLVHSDANNAEVIANLTAAVNQQSWTIPWTPDDGKATVVFDAFRGTVTRDWDQYLSAVTLTLLIPALPFTRDLNPIMLGASSAAVVTVNTGDSATGLVVTLPSIYADQDGEGHGQGLLPNSYSVDTSSHVTGSGSIKVTSPTYTGFYGSNRGPRLGAYSGGPDTNQYGGGTTSTDVTHFLQGTFSAATNLAAMQTVAWSAMSDAAMASIDASTDLYLPPGDPSQADPAPRPQASTWRFTLLDATGLRSSWDLTNQAVNTSWGQVSVNISATPTAVDPGFDITTCVGWRLRYAGIYRSSTTSSTVPTLEVFTTGATQPTTDYRLANATATGGNTQGQVATSVTAGTSEASTKSVGAVVAGSTYTLAAYIAGYATASNTVTMQVGIEWLNSSAATISTSYSAVAAGATNLNSPVTVTATAPTGAVSGRARFRWLGVGVNTPLYTQPGITGNYLRVWLPHMNQGATCWLYPFASPQAATLWVDNVLAYPAGAGTPLTTSYALQTFLGIQGSARTPVSLSINAAGGATPKRALVARTPNPAPGFTPFLDAPTSVQNGVGGAQQTPTTDATALTGRYFILYGYVAGGGTPTIATYTLPAVAYGSTYAVMARMKRPSLQAMTPTVTAALVGDTANIASTGRTFGTTGQDATTWPAATWSLLTLGTVTLPPRAVSGSNTAQQMTIQITIPDTVANTTAYLDMLVLVDLAGEMALVDAPTGKAWYWLDAPTSSSFTGSIFGGSVSSRTDALSLSPYQSGQAVLNFDPGANSLTVLLDQSNSGGTVALSYYPRWSGERPDHVTPPLPPPGGYPATYTATY